MQPLKEGEKVPVAQRTRAFRYGRKGWGFESLRELKYPVHGVYSSKEERSLVAGEVGISKLLRHPKYGSGPNGRGHRLESGWL